MLGGVRGQCVYWVTILHVLYLYACSGGDILVVENPEGWERHADLRVLSVAFVRRGFGGAGEANVESWMVVWRN